VVAYSNKRSISTIIASLTTLIAGGDVVIKTPTLNRCTDLRAAHHGAAFRHQERSLLCRDSATLFEETWNTDLAAMTAEAEQQRQSCHPPNPSVRVPVASHYRIIYHASALSRTDPVSAHSAGNALVKIGEDVSEQLDVEPARFIRFHAI